MKCSNGAATMIFAAMLACSSSAMAAPKSAGDISIGDADTVGEWKMVLKDVQKLPKEQQEVFFRSLRADPRIIGGSAVEIADFPWQAALVNGRAVGRYQFCGGSIIGPDTILTAAHCLANGTIAGDHRRVDIVAGTNFYAEGGERIKARALFVHPQYDSAKYDYDVAIIKLEKPVELGKPIAMRQDAAQAGEGVWVTGWGAITMGGKGSPEVLGAQLPIVSRDTCNNIESYGPDGITDRMLCAGYRDGGVDACQGDSGGPLSQGNGDEARLVGIVSWGEGCGLRLKYGVYTNVTSVLGWIQSQMNN